MRKFPSQKGNWTQRICSFKARGHKDNHIRLFPITIKTICVVLMSSSKLIYGKDGIIFLYMHVVSLH